MIKPLGERVLVEPSEQEETTSFGIVLPDLLRRNRKRVKLSL